MMDPLTLTMLRVLKRRWWHLLRTVHVATAFPSVRGRESGKIGARQGVLVRMMVPRTVNLKTKRRSFLRATPILTVLLTVRGRRSGKTGALRGVRVWTMPWRAANFTRQSINSWVWESGGQTGVPRETAGRNV